ncbi:MAG: DNA-binding protein [Thermincola sp.]|jgi:predicted DNA-binding protein with PD1-like motif|nr:DNA-binding protein [Thermincola sp.]MDT3704893.1 DNA-binding protein [Thermincola sp.]
MKFTEANLGRIFILRLEHGDRIPDVIEEFAKAQKVESATVLFIGGAEQNSKVVVGPEDGTAAQPVPTVVSLAGVSEAVGVGTIFVNEDNVPKLHLHSAFGRNGQTVAGCTREGVYIWHIGEVIILEMTDVSAQRKINPGNGFELLEV